MFFIRSFTLSLLSDYHSSAKSLMLNLNHISGHMCVLMPLLSCLLFSFNQNLLTKPLRFLQSLCHCRNRRNNNAADVISIGSHKNEVGAATTTATAAIELRNNEKRQQHQHHHQHSFCCCRRCLNKPYVNKQRCGSKVWQVRWLFCQIRSSNGAAASCTSSSVIARQDNVRHAQR